MINQTDRSTIMGNGPTLTRDHKLLLKKDDLAKLAKSTAVDLPGGSPNKGDIVDALEQGGVTDEQFRDAITEAGYADQLPADDTTPPAAPTPPPSTPPSTPPAPPATKANSGPVDLDEWEPAGTEAPEIEQAGEALPAFEEQDVPLLEEMGAAVRKIVKTKRHTQGGQGTETWWCPWTDHSRLTGSVHDQGLDQIPQSKAIRIGRFAVILPPQGIDAAKFNRLRKRR